MGREHCTCHCRCDQRGSPRSQKYWLTGEVGAAGRGRRTRGQNSWDRWRLSDWITPGFETFSPLPFVPRTGLFGETIGDLSRIRINTVSCSSWWS